MLGELFPGFHEELMAAGTPVLDYRDLSKTFFSIGGHQSLRTGGYTDPVPVFFPSRPLLESVVRQRVRVTANITLLEGHDVVDLTSTPAADRVTGVRVRSRDADTTHALATDLVVDATALAADLVVDATAGVRARRCSWRIWDTGAQPKTKSGCAWCIPVSCCGSRREH